MPIFQAIFILVYLLISLKVFGNYPTAGLKIQQHNLSLDNKNLVMQEISPSITNQNLRNILLVHGLTYSSHQFDVNYEDYSLARFLARHGFRVWLIDITGYGLSSKPNDGFIVNSNYAADDIALAVHYIRKTHQVKSIDLLGWSWGTITTARFAGKHPEWVNKLVLLAPIYRGFALSPPIDDYQSFSIIAAQEDMPKLAHASNIIDYQKIIKPVVDLYTQQCITYDSAGSPNGGRRDLFQAHDVILFSPATLTMPVMIIAGTADPYLDLEQDIPQIIKLLPNSNNYYYEVENGSHILMLEKKYYKNFQQELLHFLNQQIMQPKS